MGHHPNTELVTVALLKTVPGLGSNVATDLPSDNSTWSASGFVQVMTVGGTPDAYLPLARPIVSVDCWAVSPSSSKPPWGKANGLAEYIRDAVHGGIVLPKRVSLGVNYNSADVLGAWMLTEPRRIVDDDADYAHFTFDLQVDWVEVS
jgi:hypothetical protein